MKFSDILLRASAAAVMVTAMAVSARADYTTGTGGFTTSQTAITTVPSGFSFTPNAGALNYDSATNGYSVTQFLMSSGTVTTGSSLAMAAGGTGCTPASTPPSNCYSSLYEITGTFNFAAGSHTISLTHDDGVLVYVGAINNTDLVLSDPGPTATTTTSNAFTISGLQTVTIFYDECCGAPAVLKGGIPTNLVSTPEPTSVALLGGVLVGLGTIVRRKYRQTA